MKTTLLVITVCAMYAAKTLATVLSRTNDGVYLGVGGVRQLYGLATNGPVRFDERLCFMAFCNTGKVDVAWSSDLRYGCKIQMWNQNGREVSKTRRGREVGSKFDQLLKDTPHGMIYGGGSYTNNVGLGGGAFLPRPNELFDIKEPGVYRMEIEFQMFRMDRTNQLPLHFPPLRLRVEKPAEK